MEEEVKLFWQNNPCGAELVGDLTEKSKEAYQSFFNRYDQYRYAKEPHILSNLKQIYQTENGLRKNCGSPHEVRAQKRHTYFVRVSAIFANHFV
jgi:hypothetical protein